MDPFATGSLRTGAIREYHTREGRKTVRARRQEEHCALLSLDIVRPLHSGFIAAVVPGTRPSQSKFLPGSGALEAPRLAEEPSAVNGCRDGGSHLSLAGWPLVGCPCSTGQPHSDAQMGSTNWTPWFIFF